MTRIQDIIEDSPTFGFVWNHASEGMAFVRPSGHIEYCNQTLASFLGYTVNEMIGKHFAEITISTDVKADQTAFQELLDEVRSEYTMNKAYIPKMGPPRPARLTVVKSPFEGEGGVLVFGTVLPLDPFEAGGVTEKERAAIVKQAVGDLILKNWKIWVPILFALAGVANLGKIIETLVK